MEILESVTLGVPAVVMSRAVATSRANPAAAWSVFVPALASFMSIVITIFLWRWAVRAEQALSELDFRFEAIAHQQALQANFEPMFDSLYALRAFVAIADEVRLDEFEKLAEVLIARNPALRALEWIPHLPGEARADHEAHMRGLGFPDYRITERRDGAMVRAAARDVYMPVMWVVPKEGNDEAFGYDLLSEPMRRRALQRAISDNQLILTEPIELVQDRSSTPGFLVALPLYRATAGGGPVKRVRGVVLGVFQSHEFVKVARGTSNRDQLLVRITDAAAAKGSGQVFIDRADTPGLFAKAAGGGLTYRASLPLGGREWSLTIAPHPDRMARYSTPLPLVILAAGILFTGLMGVLCFTSLRSLRYQRLIAAEKEIAEAAGVAKSRFLANMSHEIRTPMNAVLGFAEVLHRTSLSDAQKGHLQQIQSAGRHLLALLDDILDYSKIGAGKLELERIEFSLEEVIQRVADSLRLGAQDKGLTFSTHADPELPASVAGDITRLCQILLNLVSNAIKFTTDGEVTLRAQLVQSDGARTYADAHAHVKFTVADTGVGIAPEKLEQIFGEFSQADGSTTREYGGTGLGLTIARQLVELMGGTLDVESEVDRGTTFHFQVRFPVARWTGDRLAATSHHLGQKSSNSDRRRDGGGKAADKPRETALKDARILVAEDNPINQELVAWILGDAGAAFDIVDDGHAALRALREESYDAVVLDAQMPILDGYETARAIRTELGMADIPIIAVTANAMSGDDERCLQAGMNDYLAKPIDAAALIARLTHWLGAERTREPAGADTGDQWPDELPGLDIRAAVDRLRGKRQLYVMLLNEFLASSGDTMDGIRAAASADRTRARKLVHELVGVAGIVGATDLYALCQELEQALASDGDLGGDGDGDVGGDVRELLANVEAALDQARQSGEHLQARHGQSGA